MPGDKVDVIATLNRYGGSDQSVSKTILQKIDVLAAGEKTQQKSDKIITVQSVTLLVDPAGAQTLALATQEGKITLVLRNPNDTDTVIVTAVNSDELMGKKKVVPPRVVIQKVKEAPRVVVPPPPKPDSVAILRGSNKIVGPPAMSEQGK